MQMKKTLIFAHRGSSSTHPENTIAAFREAMDVGADAIELDVQMTKDNELVVIHDEALDRTTNGSGMVRDYTLDELKKLDAGSWFSEKYSNEKIPTLKEVFTLLKGKPQIINIEIKNNIILYDGIEEAVIKLVHKYDLTDRVIISSFNMETLKKVRKLSRNIETAALISRNVRDPWNYVKAIGVDAVHCHKSYSFLTLCLKVLFKGIPIRFYTVNKKQEWRRLFKLKADGFFTDFPEKAIELRNRNQ
jgi:glycerophosphoryl diester phosphodiesterase